MPADRKALFDLLDRLGIATTTVDHPPLFTVEESQALRGQIAGAHSKNLFLKDKKDRLFLVVAEEDAVVDLKRIHTRIDCARVSFGSPALLYEVFGLKPGSVTPFGAINDHEKRVTVVLDTALMAKDPLNFHPLENTATTTIRGADLIAFLRATGHEPVLARVSGAGADELQTAGNPPS